MNQQQVITASNIKYLLVLRELNLGKGGVRCVDVAEKLGVTRPSVHAMMNTLKQLELIQKDYYGTVRLTEQGAVLAERYHTYFETACRYFGGMLPQSADVKTIVCILLAELSDDSLETLCGKIQQLS